MTEATTREIEPGPMFSSGMGFEPFRTPGIDLPHLCESIVIIGLRRCSSGFPKEWNEVVVLQFFVEIGIEMLNTITMRTSGKHQLDSVDETLLPVGKKDEFFVDKGLERIALNNRQKKLQKPKPIVVVFSVDNGVANRKKATVGINCSGSEKNTYT